jgi:uncharacterized membrane protein
MKKEAPEFYPCQICGKVKPASQMFPAELVRSSISVTIIKDHPKWSTEGFICRDDLNHYRAKLVEQVLETEKGELSALEKNVLDSLKKHRTISGNINSTYDKKLTMGERMADHIASFGGSWRFISAFGAFIVAWIILNAFFLAQKPIDPFPFILLNLMLSCLAAIQAPIIMMSQNRQESRDRLRSEYDYAIDLKAELEIQHMNEKIDHLLQKQWQRLLEIQQIQMDLMAEIVGKKRVSFPTSFSVSENGDADVKSSAIKTL